MADIFTKQQRSKIMASIFGKETKPEILLRKELFKRGFRFRKNVKSLPGKPDIVLKKYQTIIFVNGCFWHGHKSCKHATLPTSNVAFWARKIAANITRDQKNISLLRSSGWKVIVVWQCQMSSKNKLDKTARRIKLRLNASL